MRFRPLHSPHRPLRFLRRSLPLAVLLTALAFAAPAAEARMVIKMASLVPDGSVWDKILKEMGSEWQEATDGEVTLRMYAGGIAGDEPDVVRKMRIGQLHAAALSVTGLTTIDESFEVFEIPMFFESYEELFHVLETLRPEFEARLEAKGYVLLHWGRGGGSTSSPRSRSARWTTSGSRSSSSGRGTTPWSSCGARTASSPSPSPPPTS